MRIWRASYHHKSLGTMVAWFSNKDAAEKWVREQIREGGPSHGATGVTAMNITPTRAGILTWLNARFGSDNG